jgi:hypothetical protein
MEPIDIETIEQADLFAFGLNTAQVNDWRENYEAKHSFFLRILKATYMFLNVNVPDDDLYRCLFVIVISFERYYQSLPESTNEDYEFHLNKWVTEFKKERRNLSPSQKSKFIAARHKQPNLANYLMNKLNKNNDGWNKYNGPKKYLPAFNLMMYCDVLNTAIEKLLVPPTE